MNISVPSANLQHALKKTVGLVKEKHSIPILNYFLFDISENSLNIIASSQDGVRMSVNVSGVKNNSDESVKVCVPQKVKEIMDTLTDNEVILDFQNDQLTVKSSSGGATIQTIPAGADYPQIGFNYEDENFSEMDFPALQMLNGINFVSFACSNNNLRPALQCVHIEIEDNSACFVATNSICLARYKVERIVCPDIELNILNTHANYLKSLISQEGDLKMTLNKSQAMFSQNGNSLICPLVVAPFPRWKKIVPTNITSNTSLKKTDFLKSLTRVGVCTSQSSPLIKMDVSSELMKLSGEDIRFGTSATDKCKCEMTNPPFSIGMNVDVLKTAIANIPSDEIKVEFVAQNTPLLVSPKSDVDVIILVMPANL